MDTHGSGGHERRDFLKLAGATAMGAAIAPMARAQQASASTAVVSVVKDAAIGQAVRDAVELSGGLDFIKPGQRVLIKPNATGGIKHPFTTNPAVVYEVVKMVAEAGCEDIYVGDRCFFFIEDTMGVLKQTGHFDAAKQAESELGGGVKVTVVPFDQAGPHLKEGSPIWRQINHPLAKHYTDENGADIGFRLAEILFQMDHVINIPCAKTHFQAWFTMSMKSFVGMSHPDTRRFFHRYSTGSLVDQKAPGNLEIQPDVTPFTNRLVELNLGFTPSLNIIDATIPVVNGGPSSGDIQKADVIIASRDRIAADVAGIAHLQTLGTERRLQTVSPWRNPMVRYARRLGIGVKRRSEMTFKHKGLDNLAEWEAKLA